MLVTSGSGFVGRQREMTELKAALEEAIAGQGRLVMLVGEPGSGKTRTSEELARFAQQLGAAALWGRCPEDSGVPPYWPWAQAIRSYVIEREPAALRAEMGAGAADLAQIVAEVKEQLPDLNLPPTLDDPEQARFRLFDSVTSFLKRASRNQPLLLVLDNLHWADPSSLRLLEFVAQELAGARMLLMGTYRDIDVSRGHPLFRTLGELTRQRLYQRVLLRGLSQDEVGQAIQAMGGIAPPAELVALVHRQTQGNPLFVGEVVRLLAQEGLLATERLNDLKNWDFRLPEGIREVIGRRLDQLSAGCNQALSLAAVIGIEFSLGLLGHLSTDQTEEQLLEALEDALGARVIEELPNTAGHYQFSHALVQETLLAELSLTRRVRLHARIAEALEQLYGINASAHAAELAHHFGQAESVLGTDKLVHYSLLAGQEELAAYAWEEAQAHFERGLAARAVPLNGIEPAQDDEAAALLFGLARARAGTAHRLEQQEAVDMLSRAFDYYERAGDVARAVAVAECPLPPANRARTGSAQFIPRALKLVPTDSRAAGRLLCSHGDELGRLEIDYEGAQEAFGRALAIARREQDVALEVRTLATSANVDFYHLHPREALEKARHAIGLARGLDDSQAEWLAHLGASRALMLMGTSEAAQQHASVALELAEKLHNRYLIAIPIQVTIALYASMGNWGQVRGLTDQGLAAAPQDNILLSHRVLLEYQLGDFDRGEVYLKRLLATIPEVVSRQPGTNFALPAQVIPWVARITGKSDLLDVAEAAGQTVLSSPLSQLTAVNSARVGLGLLAVLRHDVAAAAVQYHFLEPWRGLMLLRNYCEYILALLAHTMGNLDKAVEHFEGTLAFCRKAGYRPELAWSLCDYADTLIQRDNSGDRQRAKSLLDESLAISTELGMRPLMERVQSRLERIVSSPIAAPAYPGGLTQREVEVLQLVAQGKSNREIGEKLVISEGTARRHVSNIYDKIGVANRAEATRYALREGLVPLQEAQTREAHDPP